MGFGLGAWSLLRLERHARALQLRALSCIGLQTIRLRDLQNEIVSKNQEIVMTTFSEEDVLAASAEAIARVKSNRRLVSKGGTPE